MRIRQHDLLFSPHNAGRMSEVALTAVLLKGRFALFLSKLELNSQSRGFFVFWFLRNLYKLRFVYG